MGRGAKLKRERHGSKGPQGPRWRSRRNRRRLTVGLVLVVLLGGSAAGFWWRGSRPPGEMAPAFALPASSGGTVRLEDYRGKQPVVLVFYMVGT